jgi:hypothetical protein
MYMCVGPLLAESTIDTRAQRDASHEWLDWSLSLSLSLSLA